MSAFEGTSWVLVSGIPFPQDVAIARPSATFDDGTVSGFTGCNRYSGGYTVEGSKLALGPLISTLMACAPPADRIERDFLAALDRVAGWRLDEGRLALVDGEGGDVLRFASAMPVGTWRLTGLLRNEAFASAIEGTEVDATFGADGSLAGSSGCNRYRASFTTEGGTIAITSAAATRKLCVGLEGVMEQEAANLAAIGGATRFRVDGNSLEPSNADGARLAAYARAH